MDPLSPTGAQFESGRLTLALTALGMYLIGISSQMFIPRKVFCTVSLSLDVESLTSSQVRRFRRFTADDHKQEQFEASVEEVHNAAEDESWAPRYWKRVHYISCCMLVSIVGVCMIEFSYSRFYLYVASATVRANRQRNCCACAARTRSPLSSSSSL